MKKFLLALLMFGGFGNACNFEGQVVCPLNYFKSVTSYKVRANVQTKSGFWVDTSGFEIDLDNLDNRLLNIEKCLQNLYKLYPSLTLEEAKNWECLETSFDATKTLNKNCLVIKFVEPLISKCSGQQLIKSCEDCGPALADDKYCLEKGITPTKDCPCVWRTAIQNDWIIITPPQEYLWDVIRMATTCNLMWKSRFSECANL